MILVLKEVSRKNFKITVEELEDNTFIATYWDKNFSLEADRHVSKFETFGGAVDAAFEFLKNATEYSK